MSDDAIGFGKRVAQFRSTARISLDDLAKASGMSKSGVWEVEQGRNDPRLSTMRKLASALGVSFHQLLADDDFEPRLSNQELRVIHAMRNSSGKDNP